LNADCLHPVFVWWHTLAHRLINALSVDSGYSSAAIRERIYLKHTERRSTGGILLYTAQSGGDGTLGGLIATVPHFERGLQSALRDIHICSNHPLCSGNLFSPGKYNGVACYACELVSETSCEYRTCFCTEIFCLIIYYEHDTGFRNFLVRQRFYKHQFSAGRNGNECKKRDIDRGILHRCNR